MCTAPSGVHSGLAVMGQSTVNYHNAKHSKDGLLARKDNKRQIGLHYLAKQNIIQCDIHVYAVYTAACLFIR